MIIIIHFGCGYTTAARDRWIKNFRKLPAIVRRNLVIENDECVDTSLLLPICRKLKIPLLFDYFHWQINHKCDVEQLLPEIYATWQHSAHKIKMHISEQRKGARIGAHSDYVNTLPPFMMADIDIMIEAKMKEKATMRLIRKYKLQD